MISTLLLLSQFGKKYTQRVIRTYHSCFVVYRYERFLVTLKERHLPFIATLRDFRGSYIKSTRNLVFSLLFHKTSLQSIS